MRSLNKDEGVRVDIVPTFLGAHALPDEYKERPDTIYGPIMLGRDHHDVV
jgi:imidazolonepropionase-like amidohydrolase